MIRPSSETRNKYRWTSPGESRRTIRYLTEIVVSDEDGQEGRETINNLIMLVPEQYRKYIEFIPSLYGPYFEGVMYRYLFKGPRKFAFIIGDGNNEYEKQKILLMPDEFDVAESEVLTLMGLQGQDKFSMVTGCALTCLLAEDGDHGPRWDIDGGKLEKY